MNADVRARSPDVEPLRLTLPHAALTRLRLHLAGSLASGAALEACLAYGAPWSTLRELVRHFCDDFELERQALFRLPFFETEAGGQQLGFVHCRSNERSATPIILLHGYSAALAEFQNLIEPLSQAFHVVCPPLLGFACPRAAAAGCAELMQQLGYSRYAVHGSDLGATIALELGAARGPDVLALHVTSAPAYPSVHELEALTSPEKSQLARASELHDELCFQLPESPIEELAFALSRFDDAELMPRESLDTLLTGLALSWAMGAGEARAEHYRFHLREAPRCAAPLTVHAFPLATPSLRRFVQRRQRLVEWREHERGGCMPAIEQPELWLETLRSFGSNLS